MMQFVPIVVLFNIQLKNVLVSKHPISTANLHYRPFVYITVNEWDLF
jgi:sRNA-binding regulator protein Hfq